MADYYKKRDYSHYRPTGYPVRHRRKVPFYPMLSLSMDVRGQIRAIRRMDGQLSGFLLSERLSGSREGGLCVERPLVDEDRG